MHPLLNTFMDCFRRNKLVSSSYEFYSIVKEAYHLTQESSKNKIKGERIYMNAALNVTQQPEEEVQMRLDYKIIKFGIQTKREMQ